MKTISGLIQGTPEWHAHRRTTRNASDAPALMGASPYVTRSEMIKRHATGIQPEIGEATQRRFDAGHAVEPLLRAYAEAQADEDFYPITAVSDDGYLSASFDGVNLDETIILEVKLFNGQKISLMKEGRIPPQDYWQIVQQFAVCDTAETCLYVVGGGTDSDTDLLVIHRSRIVDDIPNLIAAWQQRDADVAAYQPEFSRAEVVATPVAGFGTLSLRVEGRVLASNLDAFKADAEEFIARLPKPADLQTDQDFADAKAAVKACKDAEDRIKAAKDFAQSQMADVDASFRLADTIAKTIAAARLALDKVVVTEEQNRRLQIVTSGRDAYAAHVAELKTETKGVWLTLPEPDFAGAIKGKRTISSMQDAVDTALANGKIAANESAKHIRAALACLTEETAEHKHLFPDYLTFIGKPVDDIRALVRARIAEHRAAEEAKAEQLREKIRQEEAAKLVAAQAAEQAARDEEARKAAEPPVVAPAASVEAVAADAGQSAPVAAAPVTAFRQAAHDAVTDAMIRLGELNARIAPLAISADGLAQLGFEPVGKGGAAKLYAESDLPHIYHAMAKVLEQAAKKGAS